MPTKDDYEYIDKALQGLGVEYQLSKHELDEIVGHVDNQMVDVDSLFRDVDNWGVF